MHWSYIFLALTHRSVKYQPLHSSFSMLTHWGRVTHIWVGKLTIIDSDNGLLPGRHQAIIWTNAGILLIGPLGTNLNEILIEIVTFPFMKMHLKMSSAKWRPFCLGLNVLTRQQSVWWNQIHYHPYGRAVMLSHHNNAPQCYRTITVAWYNGGMARQLWWKITLRLNCHFEKCHLIHKKSYIFDNNTNLENIMWSALCLLMVCGATVSEGRVTTKLSFRTFLISIVLVTYNPQMSRNVFVLS